MGAMDPLPPDLVASAIAHMNDDHAAAVLVYAQGLAGLRWATAATLLGIEETGIQLEVTAEGRDETVFIPFPRPLETPDDLRMVLVEMARTARQLL